MVAAAEKPVADETSGALVWRPYDGKVRWTGLRDSDGFASGEGTLSIFDKSGQLVASFAGVMRSGRLVGQVRAVYHTSSDRASYEGSFYNWNEHGTGTMTYRNGRRVSGVWREGELLRETPVNTSPSVSDSPDLNGSRDRLDDAFGEEGDLEFLNSQLQTSYDRLKASTDGKARDDLVVFQRAWVRYEKQVEKVATALWSARPDFELRYEQIRGVVTRQRTQEIEFVLTAIRGDELPTAPVDSTSVLNDRIKNQANALAAKTSTQDIQLLVDAWVESNKLAQIIGVARWSRESIIAAIRAQQHATIDHLSTTLSLLIETPVVHGEAPMKLPSAGTTAGLEQVVKEATALFSLASKHWEIGGNTLTALPSPLPTSTANQLSRLMEESQMLVSSTLSETDAYALKRIAALARMNDALTHWGKDASIALSRFDEAGRSLDEKDSVTRAWWSQVQLKAKSDHEGARSLLAEIPEKLRIADVPAALQRVNELLKVQPSADGGKFVAVLKSFERLLADKAMRAVDADWKTPTLPSRELLNDANKAVEEFDSLPESALSRTLKPCRDAIFASGLLLAFLNQFEPSGELDSPHPITALQKVRALESWAKVMNSHPPEAKIVIDRLRAIEKLISPKVKEYETLIKDAQVAEMERKFLRAGELYRKAWLLDKQESLLENARKCEGKASGL